MFERDVGRVACHRWDVRKTSVACVLDFTFEIATSRPFLQVGRHHPLCIACIRCHLSDGRVERGRGGTGPE